MLCPQCASDDHRAAATNSRLPDQIVRRRVCQGCGHVWFTVEVIVPDYAVGWSKGHLRKPVLRVPLELTASHTRLGAAAAVERKDVLAALREANKQRADEARERDERCAM